MKLPRRITASFYFILIRIICITMNETKACTCSRDWPGLKMRLLAFDFDGTCTIEDTTGLYYEATDKYRSASVEESILIDKEWESLGRTYLKDHQETIDRLLENIPNSEDCHVNNEWLKSFLNETHKCDFQSTKNVEESGILAGISKEGIMEIAKKVKLNPGCIHVLEQIKLQLNVISFNWSKDLIHIVLGELKHLRIVGNDFPTENNKSTGKIDNHVSTAFDKEAEFMRLAKGQEKAEGVSVYIGDSIGDLLPLLEADIGIVIGNSTTMRRVSMAFGIKLLPLFALYNHHGNCHPVQYDENISSPATSKDKEVLYQAKNWQEIGELLLGNRCIPSAD